MSEDQQPETDLLKGKDLRSDLVLLRQAVSEAWPIPANTKRVLVPRITQVALNIGRDEDGKLGQPGTGQYPARAQMAAARLLAQLDRDNVDKFKTLVGDPEGEDDIRIIRTPLKGPDDGSDKQ